MVALYVIVVALLVACVVGSSVHCVVYLYKRTSSAAMPCAESHDLLTVNVTVAFATLSAVSPCALKLRYLNGFVSVGIAVGLSLSAVTVSCAPVATFDVVIATSLMGIAVFVTCIVTVMPAARMPNARVCCGKLGVVVVAPPAPPPPPPPPPPVPESVVVADSSVLPSQSSSTLFDATSVAPGLTAALLSLQSLLPLQPLSILL